MCLELGRHLRDALPNASFIGFTGPLIEKTDANTRVYYGNFPDFPRIARDSEPVDDEFAGKSKDSIDL